MRNPFLRKLVAAFALITVAIMLPLGMLMLVCMLPIMFALDPILKGMGLKGTDRGGGNWRLDHNSFRRRGTPDTEPGIISKIVGAVLFYGFIALIVWAIFFS